MSDPVGVGRDQMNSTTAVFRGECKLKFGAKLYRMDYKWEMVISFSLAFY